MSNVNLPRLCLESVGNVDASKSDLELSDFWSQSVSLSRGSRWQLASSRLQVALGASIACIRYGRSGDLLHSGGSKLHEQESQVTPELSSVDVYIPNEFVQVLDILMSLSSNLCSSLNSS